MPTRPEPRARALAIILSTLVVSSGFVPPALALPGDAFAEPPPTVEPVGPQAVETEPIELVMPPDGGDAAGVIAGEAIDPSVELRPEIAPATPPAAPTELVDERTEYTRTVAKPDGSLVLEASQTRLHYQDADGDWQPLDLSLVPDPDGAHDLAVAGHDRDIGLGDDDAQVALAELSSDAGRIAIRALDFPSTLVTELEPAPSPAPSAATSPSPTPTPEPSPSAPSPSASPAPSASASDAAAPPAASEQPAPTGAPSPAAATPSPSPAASPSPTPTPSAEPTPVPAPSASATVSPAPEVVEPTPPPPVTDETRLVFEKDAEAGRLVVVPTDEGVEFSLVLADPGQSNHYAFALDTGGLEPRLDTDGQTVLLERTDLVDGEEATEVVGVVSAPVLYDSRMLGAPPDTLEVELLTAGTAGGSVSDDALASLGPDEVVISYTIDAEWLASPDRVFPVTLDPTVCIAAGASWCTNATNYVEHYIASGVPNTYPIPSTWLRVGYSDATDGFANMRTLLYFNDISLPDGAFVKSATLALRQDDNRDGTTSPQIIARLINKGWSNQSTWNGVQANVDGAYDSPAIAPCSSGATDCDLNIDVEKIVRAWYTRRAKDWRPNIGFQVRYATESSTEKEVRLFRGNHASTSARPLLSITYEAPHVALDFAPELGASYAPSTMVAGQATSLPVSLTNTGSGFTWNHTASGGWTYKAGYRWFDAKGGLVGSGTQSLPASVGSGGSSGVFGLAVTPPSAPGQYTLRLDLVAVDGSLPVWTSDWAAPTLLYARNKRVLSADATRWTGASVIERADFPINVVRGGGESGSLRGVELGEGATIGLDLASRNLHYSADADLGFADLVPLDLSYGYDSRHALDCATQQSPTLKAGGNRACGWHTNWDERLTSLGEGRYVYQDPSGERYLVDTDATGQLVSGAPVLLERTRHTVFDENRPASGATVNTASGLGIPGWSGTYVLNAPSATSTSVGGLGTVDLNTYWNLRFAIRTSDHASAGLAVKIRNATQPAKFADRWYVLTAGTNWTSGFDQQHLAGSIVDTWRYHQVDLYSAIKNDGDFGDPTDAFEVIALQIQSASGSAAGTTYVDGARFEGQDSPVLTNSLPSFSTNAGAASLSGDVPPLDGNTNSVRVGATTLPSAPTCDSGTCMAASAAELVGRPFVSWWWRKVGGTTVAMEFDLKDLRTNATGTITYYAGPMAPPGAINPIQVSDQVPTLWTPVVRNVADDGRQVLGFYNDAPAGTGPGAPPTQGPTGDPVKWTSYTLWAPDGNYALFDHVRYKSVPNLGDGFIGHPNAAGDTTEVSDFIATFADGSEHGFDREGMLQWIRDPDGNRARLFWDVTNSVAGQAAYTLDTIRAATDATTSGSWTYERELIWREDGATATFGERLGTVGSPIGRSTAFVIGSSGDLTRIRPARTLACAGSGASGCLDLVYTDGSNHRLSQVRDPRYVAGDASADHRTLIEWSGADPVAIVDEYPSTAARLLRVLNYAAGAPSPASRRVLWQDAAAIRASHASYVDLTADGAELVEYVPLACGGDCATNPPSAANLAAAKASANTFDGLARVSTTSQYLTPSGATVVSRRGTRAGAKVDNYVDPLLSGLLDWSQSADQYASSMAHSGGQDPDLYRTFNTYDAHGNETAVADPSWNERADYAAAVASAVTDATRRVGHWRLGEASGTSAANAVAGGATGTYTNGPALGRPGAIVNDANTAAGFDGADDYVSFATGPVVTGSYTVSFLARPEQGTTTMSVLGSRGPTDYGFDVKFQGGTHIKADIGNGSSWLTTSATIPFRYTAGRWYHVAYAVTQSGWTGYVNGEPRARGTFSGTPVLLDGNHALRIGGPGALYAGERFDGDIDEVAVWKRDLTPAQIRGTYLAARSMAVDTARTIYDREGHPIQTDDQFLDSPGFEAGLGDWEIAASGGSLYTTGNTADPLVHQPSDPAAPRSFAAYATGTTGSIRQDVALVAGQTFRFQVWARRSGTTGSPSIALDYWQRSTASWQPLVNHSPSGVATWTGFAWDATLPFDTDGRVRVVLGATGVGAGDAIHYDDAAVLTTWGRTMYTANGLPERAFTFSPAPTSGIPEIEARTAHAATAEHPPIFATSVTANWVDGTFDPALPDTDVTTTAAYDRWGRAVLVTDPDGVDAETAYESDPVRGQYTDVEWTEDGLDNRTTYAYDAVGNQTSLDPAGPTGATTTTYNHAGDAVTLTPPAPGPPVRHEYDGHGFLVRTIANYVDGTGSGPAGLDDIATAYTYDALGRPTSAIANDGAAGLGLHAKAVVGSYDLLGNPTAETTYSTYDAATGTYGGARTASAHHRIATGNVAYPAIAAARGPIAPTGAPAPLCPDGGGQRCNAVGSFDLDGQPIAVTDAYGVTARTFRDLAGRPVFEIANHADGVYSGAAPDTDLVSTTLYDIGGRARGSVDVLLRRSFSSFDALGRPTAVATYDAAGTGVGWTRTAYTPAGRVELASAPADTFGAADSTLTWTRTVYDGAGRTVRTLANYDLTGAAQSQGDAFESGIDGWSAAADAWFLAAGGSVAADSSQAPVSGDGTLRVTTSGLKSGGALTLAGTFKAGRTYRLRAHVWLSGGNGVEALLGQSVTNSTNLAAQSLTGSGWRPVDLTWTPSADVTGARVAFRTPAAAAFTFYVDNVAVWDTGSPDRNIPTETAYDAAGRVVASIVAPGDPATEEPLVTRTAYDALDRVTSVTTSEIRGASGDDVNLSTGTTYDALGRTLTVTDPTGTVTRYGYDRLGNLTSTIQNYQDGTSGPATDQDVTTTFGYSAVGELTGVCPAVQVHVGGCDPASATEDQAWRYAFDAAGHLVRQTPPDNAGTDLATRFWTYDPGGRLTAVCDEVGTSCASTTAGRRSVPAYDAVGRVTRLDTYDRATGGSIALTTETTYLGDGQVASTTGSGDTISATYDLAGRPDQLKRGTTVLTDYDWNPDGTLASRTDDGVGTTGFGYDWADRLTLANIPDNATTANPTFAWRNDGLIASRTFGGSASVIFGYDRARRLTEIGLGSRWLRQTYDRDGNVTSESRSLPVAGDAGTGTQSFTYDALNRVTGSSGLAASASYTYDRNGNRKTKTTGGVTLSYLYDRTDQLRQVGDQVMVPDQAFAYNAYGDLTAKVEDDLTKTTAYSYDLAGRLTGIEGPAAGTSDDATFTLDALGRFRTRTLSGSTDTYGYLGTSETVVRIANTVGGEIDSYVDSAGSRLAVAAGTTINWYLPDPHGNVAAAYAADETTVVSALRYDAWGEIVADAGGGASAVGEEHWKYQGRLDVSPPGVEPLYDMSARFYSPSLGTFTQLDSVIGQAQDPRSMNRFLYAHANPATLIDPTGHAACRYGPEDCAILSAATKQPLAKKVSRQKPQPGRKAAKKKPSSGWGWSGGGWQAPRRAIGGGSGARAEHRTTYRRPVARTNRQVKRQGPVSTIPLARRNPARYADTRMAPARTASSVRRQIWENRVGTAAARADRVMAPWIRPEDRQADYRAMEVAQLGSYEEAARMGPSQCAQDLAMCFGFLGAGFAVVAAAPSLIAGATSSAVGFASNAVATWGATGASGLCMAYCQRAAELLDDALNPLPGPRGGSLGAAHLDQRAMARKASAEYADAAQARGATGAAASVVTPNGVVATAGSTQVDGIRALNPGLESLLESIPLGQRGVYPLGACAEQHCVSQLLDGGHTVASSFVSVVRVRRPGSPLHGAPLAPCGTCRAMLEALGIGYQ